jgi:hypothetical protein
LGKNPDELFTALGTNPANVGFWRVAAGFVGWLFPFSAWLCAASLISAFIQIQKDGFN